MGRNSKGFTLVEILITVLIIATLGALVLPRISDQAGKAIAADAINKISAIRGALLSYYDQKMTWPADVSDKEKLETILGISIPASQYGWSFQGFPTGADDYTVEAFKDDNPGNSISLQVVTGAWSGKGDYTPETGKYSLLFPNQQFIKLGTGGRKKVFQVDK